MMLCHASKHTSVCKFPSSDERGAKEFRPHCHIWLTSSHTIAYILDLYLFIGNVYVFMDEDIARQARAGPVGPNWWPTACNLPPTGLPHPTPAQVCLKTLVTQCTDHLCYVGSAGVMLCLKYKSCWSQRAADASSAWSVRPRYPCIANQGLTRPCPPPHTHSTPLMHTNGSYSSSSSSAAAAAAAGFFLPGPLNVAAFSSGSSPTL